MTREGLLELADVTKRDHPSFRWGQAICNKFFNTPHELYYADDARTAVIVEQMIKDYQL
jgi:hypothetical protein